MATGLLVLLTGFLYDVVFAGIPFQDPTPEIASGYAFHAHVASVMYGSGAAILLAGIACAVIRWILLRIRPQAVR